MTPVPGPADPTGNRTEETVNGVTVALQHNALNQLSLTGAALPAVIYEWDAEDRLVAINQVANRTKFSYDGQSRRVKTVEKANGTITSARTYLWCGLQLCEERDATGAITQRRHFAQGVQVVSGVSPGASLHARPPWEHP